MSKKVADMTQEEHEKVRVYSKQYREKHPYVPRSELTPDELEKARERSRAEGKRFRENNPESLKASMRKHRASGKAREAERKRMAAMSSEEHEIFLAKKRDNVAKRIAALTPEQKVALLKRQAEQANKKYKAKTPEEKFAYMLVAWGLTIDDYNRLLAAQGGVCAICKQPPSVDEGRRRFHIEHNHTTGAIRGLTCSFCNTSLVATLEDPLCAKTQEYLDQYRDAQQPQCGPLPPTDKRKRAELSQEERFAQDLKKRWGLTVEWYENKLKSQGGGCAICGKAPKTRRLHIDHNHITGVVRGLLCDHCNTTRVAALEHPAIDAARAFLASPPALPLGLPASSSRRRRMLRDDP